MYNRYLIFIALSLLWLVACQPQTNAPAPEATQAVDSPLETSEPESNMTMTPPLALNTPEATATEESVATLEPDIISAIDEGAIYIAVSTLLEADSVPPASEPAPRGFRWVVISATLSNQSDTPIAVAPEQLILIDADDARYTALPNDTSLTPQLVGITLEAGDSVAGFARFAIPESATPEIVEWCLEVDCATKLQGDVP